MKNNELMKYPHGIKYEDTLRSGIYAFASMEEKIIYINYTKIPFVEQYNKDKDKFSPTFRFIILKEYEPSTSLRDLEKDTRSYAKYYADHTSFEVLNYDGFTDELTRFEYYSDYISESEKYE